MGYTNMTEVLAQITVPEAASWTDLVRDGGAIAVLIWIVIGAVREWWHTDAAYKRQGADKDAQIAHERKEKEQWKEIALRSLNTTDKVVTQLEPPP